MPAVSVGCAASEVRLGAPDAGAPGAEEVLKGLKGRLLTEWSSR